MNSIVAEGEKSGFTVHRAGNASAALALLNTESIAVAVLDWKMTDMAALELTRRIRLNPRSRNLPIILLGDGDNEFDMIAGLDSGADYYLCQPVSVRELFGRAKALLRVHNKSDRAVSVGGLRLEPNGQKVVGRTRSLVLAPTEFRVLSALMKRPGRVLTRPQILSAVWHDSDRVEERTVDVCIRRLRLKLQQIEFEAAIETVRNEGYRFVPRVAAE